MRILGYSKFLPNNLRFPTISYYFPLFPSSPPTMHLLITCPSGFVSTLNQELKYLRFKPFDSFDTGTYIETDLEGMMTINLWSRMASKVYIKMGEAQPCETFEELFAITQAIERTERLPASEFLEVEAHCYQSTLMSEKSVQSIVHKAILTQVMAH